MLRRIDTTPVPSRGSLTTRAEQLEEQVRSFRRIDQQQLAAAGLALAERRARERGRKEHVVQLHRAPAALAHIVRRGEEHLGPRVGDDQLPFHVREQDRIGRRVDDAEEQRVLAPHARIVLAEARRRRRRRAARHRPSASATHVTLAVRHVRRRADEQQPERRLVAGSADLDRRERAVAEDAEARVARAVKGDGRCRWSAR